MGHKKASNLTQTQHNARNNDNNTETTHKEQGRDIFTINIADHNKFNVKKQLLGFFIYFVVFVVAIPTMLYKKKYYGVLEGYLPNLDLIANLLSFHGGPTLNNTFSKLYLPTPTTLYGFLSQASINYMALLGVTYIIARETKLTKSILKGWSLGFVMLIITYLLPSQFITQIMNNVYAYLSTDKSLPLLHGKHNMLTWKLTVAVGSVITIAIIMFEKLLIETFREKLIDISKFVSHVPQKI